MAVTFVAMLENKWHRVVENVGIMRSVVRNRRQACLHERGDHPNQGSRAMGPWIRGAREPVRLVELVGSWARGARGTSGAGGALGPE